MTLFTGGIVLYKLEVVNVIASYLGIKNLNIAVGTIFMFLDLEITVYNVQGGPIRPSKHALYYDLEILLSDIGFDHFRLLFVS